MSPLFIDALPRLHRRDLWTQAIEELADDEVQIGLLLRGQIGRRCPSGLSGVDACAQQP
jgi:hypothetical protein